MEERDVKRDAQLRKELDEREAKQRKELKEELRKELEERNTKQMEEMKEEIDRLKARGFPH